MVVDVGFHEDQMIRVGRLDGRDQARDGSSDGQAAPIAYPDHGIRMGGPV